MSNHRGNVVRVQHWLLAFLIAGGWAAARPLRAAESSSKTTKASAGKAEGTDKLDPKVEAKLNDILARQEQILQRLDQVMEELKIVKIRATVR